MEQKIKEIFQEVISVKEKTLKENLSQIVQSAEAITMVLRNGGKLVIFGNGGSAADSQHLAAEFIGRFQRERCALAAISLTTDTSIITSLGNDYGFERVFSRQIEALGLNKDIALAISTSGNSPNVLEAVKVAKQKGMKTISLTGNDGGKLAKMTDININVPSKVTARIQEAHICVGHIICELVEEKFSR